MRNIVALIWEIIKLAKHFLKTPRNTSINSKSALDLGERKYRTLEKADRIIRSWMEENEEKCKRSFLRAFYRMQVRNLRKHGCPIKVLMELRINEGFFLNELMKISMHDETFPFLIIIPVELFNIESLLKMLDIYKVEEEAIKALSLLSKGRQEAPRPYLIVDIDTRRKKIFRGPYGPEEIMKYSNSGYGPYIPQRSHGVTLTHIINLLLQTKADETIMTSEPTPEYGRRAYELLKGEFWTKGKRRLHSYYYLSGPNALWGLFPKYEFRIEIGK